MAPSSEGTTRPISISATIYLPIQIIKFAFSAHSDVIFEAEVWSVNVSFHFSSHFLSSILTLTKWVLSVFSFFVGTLELPHRMGEYFNSNMEFAFVGPVFWVLVNQRAMLTWPLASVWTNERNLVQMKYFHSMIVIIIIIITCILCPMRISVARIQR